MVFTAPSCKKDGLTKETQTGSNTFSCKIDGKIFVPCDGGFFSSGPSLYAHYSSNYTILRIGANCTKDEPYKYMFIELNNFHGVGEYLLSDINNTCTYIESYPTNKDYTTTLTKNGKVIITKDDRNNSILSGTFEFTATDKSNNLDLITISSGRFDIKPN